MPEDNAIDLRWLHISDFHFKADVQYDQDVVLRALLKSLPKLIHRIGHVDVVFATGDIADTGLPSEYVQATQFFDKIIEILGLSKERLFVVPGNHDVDRRLGKGLVRSLSTRKEADAYFDPCQPLPHIQQRQFAFSNWFNEYFSGIRKFPEVTTCGDPETVVIRNSKIAVLPINTAVFSSDDQDHGKLHIGRRCVSDSMERLDVVDADLKFVLMHHSFDWLNSNETTNVKSAIRSSADLILSGHMHWNEVEQVVSAESKVVHLVAGAAYQTRDWPNRAMFAEISNDDLTVLPIHYVDSAKEMWVVDTSIFPESKAFEGNFIVSRKKEKSQHNVAIRAVDKTALEHGGDERKPVSVAGTAAKAEFEQDLLAAPSGGKIVYAEPRLMKRPQEPGIENEFDVERVSIDALVTSSASYLIEARAEFGSSMLCKRLAYEFTNSGVVRVSRRDARNLPNYKKKLELEFQSELQSGAGEAVLILDHFDLGRDEKLLKELSAMDRFGRIIIVTVNRSNSPSRITDPTSFPFDVELLYLWSVGRSDVRSMAAALFDSSDDQFISSVVDKVYSGLLGLCIPLTPANVIMYLRVLHREVDFHPLNRVDIVSRYLEALLRRPSDAYRDTFNLKNKTDVLSAFVFSLYKDQKNSFDDTYWHIFIQEYQKRTLTDFDAAVFLHELLESRIFVRSSGRIYLKYSFFFSYFMGRYISARPDALQEFLRDEEYLRMDGVVDVITGLSSENSLIVKSLTEKLRKNLAEFSGVYIKGDFDPLIDVVWPDDNADDDELWKPIEAQIESGPRNSKEIDVIKSSFASEVRTADQEVRFRKYAELESSLFLTLRLLGDALRNSDDIDGPMKMLAFDAVLDAHKVCLQLGTMLSGELAKHSFFLWGGIGFFGFDRAAKIDNERSYDPRFSVVTALSRSLASKAAEEIATRKLSGVFREKNKAASQVGFSEFVNFSCTLQAKGQNWEESLSDLIKRTDKNAFYLSAMLGKLMTNYRNEVNSTKEREGIKRLVALVRAKRQFKKQSPGAKAVRDMLSHLEDAHAFDPNLDDQEK